MRTQVTIYRNGQISRQFHKTGFKAALSYAAHELGKAVEHLTLDEKTVQVETEFLSPKEWTCTVTCRDDEVFGITVEDTK